MLLKEIYERARIKKSKVGIGCFRNEEIIKESITKAKKEKFANLFVFENAEKLISALKNNEVDAVVRGTLSASEVLNHLKIAFNLNYILRIAIMEINNKEIFLSPVGIDEGNNLKQKKEIVFYGVNLMKKFGITPNIAILSKGRKDDFGRSKEIDSSLKEGEKIANYFNKSFLIKNYGIEIENAIKNCNFLILPNGVIGNYIFRTLYYLGEAKSYGAVVVNFDKVFIDTSRGKKSYVESIALASALVNNARGEI